MTSKLLLLCSLRMFLGVIIRKKEFECHLALHSLFILLLRPLPLVFKKNLFIIFYYILYTVVMSKRNKILFQHYVHNAKKFINCYYLHQAAIMTKKHIFSFQHYYIHFTVMMKKNYFFPYCYLHYVVIMSKKYFPHSYYVHYTVIMTKIYVFLSAIRVLHLYHVKKYTFMKKNYFPIATTFTTFVIMTNFFIYCCYIHYAMISTMSTTPQLRKKAFQFSFQHYLHYVLITTENKFISNNTFPML